MTANVIGSGGVPDSTYGGSRRAPDERATPAGQPAAAAEAPLQGPDDLLLVIADDPAVGGMVYKTIDRRTGAVVRTLSRSDLLRLRETAGYAAGAVLRTRA
jgi:hypothetical protein